ncbi:MAG: hypothetical protein HN742_11445 [Lentisphaerae bacterium]|nr:hypothetical protein [Lentisphaerota bacterium]MBT4817858.1 hypothetical protein [Lentisphaerota bacterium]MBT5613192.1 hypothetical protein [Lentisphaerota bacterium]MBT7059994.1 hypothetical protein [Lentisphaerota bacterium]MBT7842481.1 hypothetical protein [Lentisphaerota bacterium]
MKTSDVTRRGQWARRAEWPRVRRFMCRLLGDETGLETLEYVVLGFILITLAVGVGAIISHAVKKRAEAAAHLINGQTEEAQKAVEEGRKATAAAASQMEEDRKKVSDR